MKKLFLRKILLFILCLVSATIWLGGCNLDYHEQETASNINNINSIPEGNNSSEIISKEEQSSTVEGLSSNDKDAVSSNLSEQQNNEYFKRYLYDFYMSGLVYAAWDGTEEGKSRQGTWNSAEELSVERLIDFYKIRVYYPMAEKLGQENPEEYKNKDFIAVNAQDVEDYLKQYFDISSEFLRNSQAYSQADNTYHFETMFGIGGGPGLEITKIEETDSTLKLYYHDFQDYNLPNNFFILNIILTDEGFKYISGKQII